LASHLLSAGCMGTMILGMIARVSLGHSGRALQVGRRI
ncbi:NnrS family protein, partial [Aeromonas veronii]